jgi:hypothetical protein
MNTPSVLLSLALVACLATPQVRFHRGLAALSLSLLLYSLGSAHGLLRGAVVGLVFVMGAASVLALLAGVRPSWVRPVASTSFALGTIGLFLEGLP